MTHRDVTELLDQLAHAANAIPVRAEKGGRWGSHFLEELTPEERLAHTVAFIERRAPGTIARAQAQLTPSTTWTIDVDGEGEITMQIDTDDPHVAAQVEHAARENGFTITRTER